jgi:hypothetical protein
MKSQIPRPLNQTLPIEAQDILIAAATGDIKGNMSRAEKINRAVSVVMTTFPGYFKMRVIDDGLGLVSGS